MLNIIILKIYFFLSRRMKEMLEHTFTERTKEKMVIIRWKIVFGDERRWIIQFVSTEWWGKWMEDKAEKCFQWFLFYFQRPERKQNSNFPSAPSQLRYHSEKMSEKTLQTLYLKIIILLVIFVNNHYFR